MNKEEFREHCEKQIERCIKLNDSRHLKEHELALGLLNENERLIQKNQELKKQLEAKGTQQKKFMKWLDSMLVSELGVFTEVKICDVLSKYKEIIGKDINVGTKEAKNDN